MTCYCARATKGKLVYGRCLSNLDQNITLIRGLATFDCLVIFTF